MSATGQLPRMDRRLFVQSTAGLLASLACGKAWAGEMPKVTDPRATSGDEAYEPNWEKRLTITVGPRKADLVGSNEKVIQAAVDYIARMGGGTVHILAGTFKLRNAVYLPSKVHILGSGLDSVLIKEPSISAVLSEDSEWYDQEITLEDGKDFRVGDGICIKTKDWHTGSTEILKRTFVARDGNRFKLDKALRKNIWLNGKPTATTLFPLFSGEFISDVLIENITLDGNKDNNDNLNGNHAGCIFLQDCNRVTMRGVEARNYNGDGISWQVSHDVIVEDSYSHDNAGLGLHPGSGAQRTIIRRNKVERTEDGIFFCWGVRYGLAEDNTVNDVRNAGVSIGHNDTDNIVRGNVFSRSGKVGVLFRDDSRGKDFWPNRNRIENNRIIDSGNGEAAAVDIQGQTKSIELINNEIRETRAAESRIGVKIGAKTTDIHLTDNQIEGFAKSVVDER
jgi:hypothetical protein